jgi:hypothetical protein
MLLLRMAKSNRWKKSFFVHLHVQLVAVYLLAILPA